MQLKRQSARCCAPEGSFTQNYVTASRISGARTLGSAYNEFGNNEHPAKTRKYLRIKIVDIDIRKFRYNIPA